jgi:hypothetical protein
LIISFLILFAMAVPAVTGFLHSRQERRMDRRHFRVFLGFSAALLAIAIMSLSVAFIWWLGPVRFRYIGPELQTVIAISSIVQHLATVVAFCFGFFATGYARVFLIVFGPAMFLLYVLIAFGNFGA